MDSLLIYIKNLNVMEIYRWGSFLLVFSTLRDYKEFIKYHSDPRNSPKPTVLPDFVIPINCFLDLTFFNPIIDKQD